MKQLKYILFSLMSVVVLNVTAQKICDFEANSFQAIGTYDYWTQSPFNTGQLTGNMEVVLNTIKTEKDETEHILAIQRSRYGSNIFGAKIKLNEPFELTPTTKYIHVLIHTPMQSRVMLLGLGKRTERKGQSDQVVQFGVVSHNPIKANEWTDAVFSVKGNKGVIISSLVVVPHCESPHHLQEDFLAYVDEIEMSEELHPRFVTTDKKREQTVKKEGIVNKQTSYVKVVARNGELLKSDNTPLDECEIPLGKPIEIKLKSAQNFKQNGVIIQHGCLDKSEFLNGNRQWKIDTIPASYFVNGKATIPAKMIDGDLIITAKFIDK